MLREITFRSNISFRIVKQLQVIFPGCRQVRELKLENSSDKEIWSFAKFNEYAIVTFDTDFYDLVTLYGHPPKEIWLRLGNTTSRNLIHYLEKHAEIIKSFISDPNYSEIGCLEIDE